MIFLFDKQDENLTWITESIKRLDLLSISKLEFYVEKNQDQLLDAKIRDPRHPSGKDLDVRSSRILWISDEKKFNFLYEEMADIINNVNDHCYNYSLYGFECFQYSEYHASENGHYTWHIDTSISVRGGHKHVRKLSFSAGLNDNYDGGELEFRMGPNTVQYKLKKGQIIVFPSFILHRVAPVTKGVRKTLVGWSRGPNFV